MKTLSVQEIKKFHSLIWNYYRTHGRSMPWRGEKSPYKVLVSEIMLQQTQVSRVTIKYKEFLKEFPTLESLAKAPLGKVLTAWQGLGYNRRAKCLHSFAKEVVEKHKGKIPKDYQTLLFLPGIGKGTAGSLSAFAFNLPIAFIETNIRRVYIHHFFKDKTDVSDGEILPLVEQTLDTKNPREWYYALMDYGAYLKTQIPNPNIKSKHYIKQSKFEGSNREVRGAIIKFLSKNKKGNREKMMKELGFESERFEKAFEGLIQEKFVIRRGESVFLT
jgi:A/G-specific adenine glycosylase